MNGLLTSAPVYRNSRRRRTLRQPRPLSPWAQAAIVLFALLNCFQGTPWNSNSSTASNNTGFWYSPVFQSVVKTMGSGGGAVTTTMFTGTRGNPVLIQHPDGTFQSMAYDAKGNKTSFVDEQGATASWMYDALNRMTSQTLPAGTTHTVTNFIYRFTSSDETDVRAMPESLSAKAVYDSAGCKTSEELDGTGGAVTCNFSYAYYPSGADKGLLQSVSDPRGFTTTTTYDAWLRPATANSSSSSTAQQNQNTTYGYDNRGMVNPITQSYATATTGPSTQVTRTFDAYGQINQETVGLDPAGGTSYGVVSQWNQSWDVNGRRSALNWQVSSGAGSQYVYAYNANGLMRRVANNFHNYTYTYGDNGLLTSRSNFWLTQTIAPRDGRGRITAEGSVHTGSALVSETLGWRNDDRLASYTASGTMTLATTLNYGYDTRGQIQTEPYQLTSTDLETELYQFDATLTGTTMGTVSGGGNNEGGLGIRTLQKRSAGADNVASQLSNWSQVLKDNFTTISVYDLAGNVTSWGGTPLTWDAYNRLVISGTGTTAWTAVYYDGLDRRVQTTNGTAAPITYFYDPQVEFLELGHDNGGRTWNVYGPDRSGVYGGAQGTGGLEAVVTESTGTSRGVTNNYFGDALAAPDSTTRFAAVVGGYGAMPGSAAVNSALQAQWRGKYIDPTGFYYLGARYYEPNSGRFLSADPLGHAASLDLYSYCNGDLVNGFDPDGRYGKPASGGGLGSYLADRDRQFQNLVDEALRSGSVGPAQTQAQQTSNAINAIPIIGGLKMLSEGVTGYDFAAGQYLGTGDQISHAALGAMKILSAAALEKPLLGGAVDSNLGNQFRINMQRPLVAAEGSAPLLSKTGGGGAMDPALFSRIQTAFAKQGGLMQSDADAVGVLNFFDAEAATIDSKTILLRPNPSSAAVYEELIHMAQMRRGMTDVTQMEIEAGQKLINNASKYNISPAEAAQIQARITKLGASQ